MKNKITGFTLIEILMVMFLFAVIFGLTLSLIYYSNQSWRIGRLKQQTQQEARKALDFIALELRESAPVWHVDGIDYNIQINASGDAISFYVPSVNNSGTITGLEEVRIYCAGQDNRQLYKIIGQGGAVPLTGEVINNAVNQKPFFQFLNAGQTEVSIRIPIMVNNDSFVLSSVISLRNREANLTGVPVNEVVGEEGEF